MAVSILILKIIFSGFFMFTGIIHIIKPQKFKHFIPNFFPKNIVNYVVGVLEVSLALGLFFSETVKNTAIGIFILMVLFLPIHIWDATKTKPAIGSKKIAFTRIVLQFLLIYFAYLLVVNS
ncbi:MAG: hypothetical protein ACWIPJ_02330 [Polaribacter sp.]